MDKNNVVSAEIVRQITRMVVEELQKQQRLERSTPIGVSNRHVHLDRADMDALFGPGSELTVKKMLGQPGQYASEETVTREFGAYDGIRDNFPKYVVSMDEFDMSRNGIKHRNIRDFLLDENWE